MGSARGQGPSAEEAAATDLVKALYSVREWSWPGRVKEGLLVARPSARGPLRAGQAGLVGTRCQQLQGELRDDGREPPDTVGTVQEDRQRVAEVALPAEVGVPLVLRLQQVGQGERKHLVHLWEGGRERADGGLLWTETPPAGRPPTVPPTHLFGVGPETLRIQWAHTGKHWHHGGLLLGQEGDRLSGEAWPWRSFGAGEGSLRGRPPLAIQRPSALEAPALEPTPAMLANSGPSDSLEPFRPLGLCRLFPSLALP